jgi:hypothetical protein
MRSNYSRSPGLAWMSLAVFSTDRLRADACCYSTVSTWFKFRALGDLGEKHRNILFQKVLQYISGSQTADDQQPENETCGGSTVV